MTNSGYARQTASAVLMVRPRAFGFNPQTGATNTFQTAPVAAPEAVAAAAANEFDALSSALDQSGVEIVAIDDPSAPRCPDAVFPNNWVSFQHDGTVVLYPMMAPNRRFERRPHRLHEVVERGAFQVTRLLDLTHHELSGRYLEGTGSIVFDHVRRLAYACLSPRTHREVLAELCAELGYRAVTFIARDRRRMPVYHTNVVLAIGRRFALVCQDAVEATDREPLLESLASSGREVLPIGFDAMLGFAGNILELGTRNGASVLALSGRARENVEPGTLARLEACVDRIVAVPVPTIEHHGGGSVRCMLAEIFLPRVRSPAVRA